MFRHPRKYPSYHLNDLYSPFDWRRRDEIAAEWDVVDPPVLPENAARQGSPSALMAAAAIAAFGLRFGVLAWPVARFAAHPAFVGTVAALIGGAIGLVVSTHRPEVQI